MKIDRKSIELGMNELLAKYLLNKTKFKNSKILNVVYHGVEQNGVICFKFDLESVKREITIHATRNKLIRFNRDILINSVIEL
jgi:hypothetical protein